MKSSQALTDTCVLRKSTHRSCLNAISLPVLLSTGSVQVEPLCRKIMKFLISVCVLSYLIDASYSFQKSNEGDCLLRIIHALDKNCSVLIASYENPLLDLLFKSNLSYIFLDFQNTFEMRKMLCSPSLYILFVEKTEDYSRFSRNFYRTNSWNPQATFIVICSHSVNITNITLTSRRYRVFKILILTVSMDIYTYVPFENGICDNSRPVRVSNCSYLLNATGGQIGSLIPRLPRQFYGCPIRAIAQIMPPFVVDPSREKYPGLDVSMLRELTNMTNITLAFVKHPFITWGYKYSDGSFSELYSMLDQEKADILCGLIILNASYDYDFDKTRAYAEDCASIFVPTALPVAEWKNYTLVFTKGVWLATLLTIVLLSVAWWLVGMTRSPAVSEGFQRFDYCILKVLCVLFSSFNDRPKSTLLRFFFLLWCITGLLICNSYQGKLASFLTKPAYDPELKDVEGVASSPLMPAGHSILHQFVYDPSNEVLMKLYKKWVRCELNVDCLNRTSIKRDFATMKSVKLVKYVMPYFRNSDGSPTFVVIRDVIFKYIIGMVMLKGSHFQDRFNEIIINMTENGMICKWLNDLQYNEKFTRQDVFKNLSVKHLKPLFFILYIGLTTAFITFLIELYYYRRAANKK